ncbi:MAG: SPOR domain-containing protein [Cyclobacteriaceae bacterium]|nr:SPOR domain-containing protein [Cyclobacteriaceae bacterium]
MGKRKKSTEETPQENLSDDNFGLPDIDYKPLDQAEEEVHTASDGHGMAEPATDESPATEEVSEESPATMEQEQAPVAESGAAKQPVAEPARSYYNSEPPKSNAPVIIALSIVLIVLLASGLIYWFVYKIPADKAAKAKQEQLALEQQKKKDEEMRLARERAEAERKKALEAANAKPKEGTIESLTDRTRRFYVVISSAVDGDLIMDFAKKLSAKGVSSKIIPPFGGMKFYRLAIADHDTFAQAQTQADQVKPEYGQGVWVIKY